MAEVKCVVGDGKRGCLILIQLDLISVFVKTNPNNTVSAAHSSRRKKNVT